MYQCLYHKKLNNTLQFVHKAISKQCLTYIIKGMVAHALFYHWIQQNGPCIEKILIFANVLNIYPENT